MCPLIALQRCSEEQCGTNVLLSPSCLCLQPSVEKLEEVVGVAKKAQVEAK